MQKEFKERRIQEVNKREIRLPVLQKLYIPSL